MNINLLLQQAISAGASDLHLTVGVSPVLRVNGNLIHMDAPTLTWDDTENLARQLLPDNKQAVLEELGEVDVSYSHGDLGFFRVNVYRQRGAIGIALRLLNTEVASIKALELPEAVTIMARRNRGLILVTGPTGSGKSTTLAAMTKLINSEKERHIVTLEDPIEYIHKNQKCIITQREIGRDSLSFPNALRAALRQDPDVIVVGEMRDLETISIAVTAGETGHLVISTLHTMDAAQTVERIIDVFPPNQQHQVRVQLANSLVGVLSQRLLKRLDGTGRIAAVEALICTPAVRNLIREGKIHQLSSIMQTGAKQGMHTFDKHLQSLIVQGRIGPEEALEHASDQENMRLYLKKHSGYIDREAL